MIHIIGGGIGGLAAAIALQRAGQCVRIGERSAAPGEIGAGIQLGPNATRLLAQWGLAHELLDVAAKPKAVQALDVRSGRVLGQLPLNDFERRYGAPYLTVHRAQLHAVLLRHAQAIGIAIDWDTEWNGLAPAAGELLIGCDGVHSAVRERFWQRSHCVSPTGHWAWRALLPIDTAPASLRDRVTAWLGACMHVVGYAVGHHYNLVAFTESLGAPALDATQTWSQAVTRDEWQAAVRQAGGANAKLQSDTLEPQLLRLLDALPESLSRWPVLAGRALQSAADMAQGRIALLGDAAHPMRPYLAQGAAMAIEDAAVLARCVAALGATEQALQTYAHARWWRNARVQNKAQQNGRIFHASGPLAWARDLALRLHPRAMDTPWLYGYRVDADTSHRTPHIKIDS